MTANAPNVAIVAILMALIQCRLKRMPLVVPLPSVAQASHILVFSSLIVLIINFSTSAAVSPCLRIR